MGGFSQREARRKRISGVNQFSGRPRRHAQADRQVDDDRPSFHLVGGCEKGAQAGGERDEGFVVVLWVALSCVGLLDFEKMSR